MSDVKWIKLATNVFDNRKIRQIEILPNGDSIIVIWMKLLCLAGNVNDKGSVYLTNEIPYTEQMLSTQFGRPLTTIQLALKTFQEFGMIDIINDIIHISSWEKYQNVEGMEKIREQTRVRVARCRENKKVEKIGCNVTVTHCNATDIEEDKEIDKKEDKEIEKDKKKVTKVTKEKQVFFADEKLNQTFLDYLEMKRKSKKPVTDRSIQIAINKINQYCQLPFSDEIDTEKAIKVVEQSILSGWQGIFDLKETKTSNKKSFEDVWRDA